MPITTASFAAVHGPDANVFTIVDIDALIIDDGTDARVGIVLKLVHRDTGQQFSQLYECAPMVGIEITTQVGVCSTAILSGQHRDDQPIDPNIDI